MFVPAPTQQTCQSSKREPSVTAVHKRRNLVSSCMYFYSHSMTHSLAYHIQVLCPPICLENHDRCEIGGSDRRVATFVWPSCPAAGAMNLVPNPYRVPGYDSEQGS